MTAVPARVGLVSLQAAADALDTVITNALIVDATGIYKADVGLKDGAPRLPFPSNVARET